MSFIGNGGRFDIERHTEQETPGNPYRFTLTIHEPGEEPITVTGLTKGDLTEFRKQLTQAIREAK